MGLVAVTAGLFAVGAYLGRDLSYGWGIAAFIASFGVLLALNVAASRSEQLAIGLLFGFGVLVGLGMAPTIAYYASTNPQSVWQAGGATALFIAGFGAAGYATRRDLSGLARLCFWALLALIVFGIVAIFVRIPNSALIYSIAGLAIFAGFTMYDFQRLRRTQDIRAAPLLAASIFLDVLNVFLLLLSLFNRDCTAARSSRMPLHKPKNVVGLVYVAAFAPEEGEMSGRGGSGLEGQRAEQRARPAPLSPRETEASRPSEFAIDPSQVPRRVRGRSCRPRKRR